MLHEEVISDPGCREVPLEGYALCPGPIPRSSVPTSNSPLGLRQCAHGAALQPNGNRADGVDLEDIEGVVLRRSTAAAAQRDPARRGRPGWRHRRQSASARHGWSAGTIRLRLSGPCSGRCMVLDVLSGSPNHLEVGSARWGHCGLLTVDGGDREPEEEPVEVLLCPPESCGDAGGGGSPLAE